MNAPRNAITMTRRTALGVLAAGGLGVAFWPRPPRGSENAPKNRVVITYWEKWTGAEGDAIQRVVDQFNAAQDRIWVRRVTVSGIREKAMLAIAGGDPPDLVGLFNHSIPLYAEAGALLPLDGFARRKRISEERYAPAVWNMLTYEGKLWAGVNTAFSFALYYNRAHFRAAGLDPDRPPRTIAELDQATERLTRFDAAGRLTQAGFLPTLPPWWPYFWPCLFGGRLYDPAANRATLTEPRTAAAYRWVRGFPPKYGRAALLQFAAAFHNTLHSAQDPFLSGRVSMIVQGPWLANVIRQFAPQLEYGCAPAPVIEELYDPGRPAGMLECDTLMIPRGCPHPEEAFEFLRFTQCADIQEQLAMDHCKGSPMRGVSAHFTAQHPHPYVTVFDAITRSPAAQTAPRTRVWQEYAQLIGGAFEAIWAGEDVGANLKRVEEDTQALLDLAAERRKQRQALRARG